MDDRARELVRVKTYPIRLEIIRQGPAHNQLLSPLVEYVALCGNHEPERFRVPFDHGEFERRLAATADPGDGASYLRELATALGETVGQLRSVLAEVAAVPSGDDHLMQIHLILTPAELAMLPFELMLSPAGFPGHGRFTSLETDPPIVFTREAFRAPPETLRWPRTPRILVVIAAPVDDVPADGHLWAIAKSLEPWLWRESASGMERFVRVLERATLAQVEDACASDDFTHVHILAHGAHTEVEGRYRKFGVALHSASDPREPDIVSGERLGAALRCRRVGRNCDGHSRPTVVTLATCNSANSGSVIVPGGSVAHALHQAGIPLVIASQFPLSKQGSVRMTEVLYGRLLRGEDPRAVVASIRQSLFIGAPETRDWASIAVYASLPPDMDETIRLAQFDAKLAMVEGAMARLEQAHVEKKSAEELDTYRARLSTEMDDLDALPTDGSVEERVRLHGLLAGAKKREAHALVRSFPALATTSRRILRQAYDHYEQAFRLNASETWALVQWLVLGAVLDAPGGNAERLASFRDHWTTAVCLSNQTLRGDDAQAVVWAHSALVELFTIAPIVEITDAGSAEQHLAELVRLAQRPVDLYAVRKQLQRYADWWWPGHPVGLRAQALGAILEERGVPATLDQDAFD